MGHKRMTELKKHLHISTMNIRYLKYYRNVFNPGGL